MLYIQKEDYTKAEEVFTRGLAIAPDNDEINFTLAIVYEKTKRPDDMFSALKRTIEINPKHADALNYLGYTYADMGINLDAALDLIKKAVELEPESGYIRDSLGWVYFKKGMFEEALREIRKASEITKDDPTILEHLGDVYIKLNNKEAAVDAWRKSLKFNEKEEALKKRVEKKIQDLGFKIKEE